MQYLEGVTCRKSFVVSAHYNSIFEQNYGAFDAADIAPMNASSTYPNPEIRVDFSNCRKMRTMMSANDAVGYSFCSIAKFDLVKFSNAAS